MNSYKIKKRQTGRRVEGVPHSYLESILAKEQRGVKRSLRPMLCSFRVADKPGAIWRRSSESRRQVCGHFYE